MNITVVTLFDSAIADWARPIAEMKRQYCAKHGYKFVCHENTLDASASPHYSKMPAILQAFDDLDCDWVFWSDADSIIMNYEQKLEEFIDPNFFLIMPTDITGHSTSNFFIRNSAWSRRLVTEWRDFRPRYDKSPFEQMVLGYILRSQNWLLHRISLAGDIFNRHPLQRTTSKFIVHLGGWHNYRRRKYVANFMNPKLSYSQYGEDLFVAEYFEGRTGMFLEIGALDGIKDSNCRKLAEMGWSGVAIEPNPHLFLKLLKNYKGFDVHPICALVTGNHGIRTLHLNQDGLTTTCPDIFAQWLERDDVHFYGSCFSPCITPDDIVKLFGDHFDFVSVDAEGMDQEIVAASKNLLKHTGLLCIETQKPGQADSHDYQRLWDFTLAEVGFTQIAHTTKGNTLLKRP